MNIAEYIRSQKQSFKDKLANRSVAKLEREKIDLEREKSRQERISSATIERDRVANEIKQIQPERKESAIMKFGQGLAKVINEQKNNPKRRNISDFKPRLNKKALSTSAKQSSIFMGSKGFSIAGNGETKEQYKPKKKTPFA